MTQINEREREMVSAKKVGIFAVIANQQGAKLIDPSEAPFRREALFVDGRVEQALPSAFGRFAVAFVLSNVGNDLMVETDFAGVQRIEGTVGIEIRTSKGQTQAFHVLESRLQMGFEVEGVMMVPRHNPGRSDDVAMSLGDGQDIRGLGAFSVLVGNTFTPFLRDGMAAIQVQARHLEVRADRLNTLLPDPLETAIGTPFLEMIVDGLPANLFFSGSVRAGAIGNCAH